MASCPRRLFNSPFSFNSLTTTAVEDSIIITPIVKLVSKLKFKQYKITISTVLVTTTCNDPKPNTILRIAIRREIENSSPKLNNKNTIPSSATKSIS